MEKGPRDGKLVDKSPAIWKSVNGQYGGAELKGAINDDSCNCNASRQATKAEGVR